MTCSADFLGDRVFTLPLVEDVPRSPHPLDERRGMVFVGNFRHLPNREAVEYLCGDILPLLDPRLLDRHPLTVLGNWLDQVTLAIDPASPGVNLVGWVPSVQPYLDRARLAVVPLRYGAGVKGKVVQSMMGYTPVVTTPIGAEGLDLVQGEHALIGSDAADLAAGITRLLTDDDLWHRLARQGADHVDARLRPEVVGPQFHEIVERVMARPAAATATAGGPAGNGRAASDRALADRIRTIAAPGDVVLVPVGGDGAVPDLAPQRAWPFPQGARRRRPATSRSTAPPPSTTWRPSGSGAPGGSPSRARPRAGATATPSCWTTSRPATGGCTTTSTWRSTTSTGTVRRAGRRHRAERHACTCWGPTPRGGPAPSPTLLAALQDSGGLTVTQSWRSSGRARLVDRPRRAGRRLRGARRRPGHPAGAVPRGAHRDPGGAAGRPAAARAPRRSHGGPPDHRAAPRHRRPRGRAP